MPDATVDNLLRVELLTMLWQDLKIADQLDASGALDGGYHPTMAAIHRKNGDRMRQILAQHGWPARSRVGDDGAEAAFLLVQHAIGDPELLRGALPLLAEAALTGEASPTHAAMLVDRICFFEGKPQRFGTQFDWDDHGALAPGAIEDPARVDERRKAVGLGPLAEQLEKLRKSPRKPPADLAAYRRQSREFAISAGWRDE